jgi:hypothetical protein
MDSTLIQNEIKLLEANRLKIDSGLVYDLLISSVKARYACEEQRKKFVISRSIPHEKIYNPKYVEPYAKDFLDCYANLRKVTKETCQNQYKNVYECLVKNHGNNYDFPVKCVAAMEDYINC